MEAGLSASSAKASSMRTVDTCHPKQWEEDLVFETNNTSINGPALVPTLYLTDLGRDFEDLDTFQ